MLLFEETVHFKIYVCVFCKILHRVVFEQMSHFPNIFPVLFIWAWNTSLLSLPCVFITENEFGASLIMHLTWVWMGVWPWVVIVLWWPFSLSVRTRAPRTAFPQCHLETSLSCPHLLFHKKNECIVAFTSYGNNFRNSLTVKSNDFALFLHWNWCHYARLSCVLVCVFAILLLRCGMCVKAFSWLEAVFPC